MEIRISRVLAGPNVWSAASAIELLVTCPPGRSAEVDRAAGKRLRAWLPGLTQHLEEATHQPLDARLAQGLRPCEALPHVISELHFLARAAQPRPRCWLEKTARRHEYRVAVECEEPFLGIACRDVAWRVVEAAWVNAPFAIQEEVDALKNLAYYGCLGPNTRPVVEAALARGIPLRRLDDVSIVQLGHGVRQRRLTTAMTDRISVLAEAISTNKDLTKRLLAEAGVPVPAGRIASDAEDAWQAAQELAGPVVVKPLDADYGQGVSLNVRGRAAVLAAYGNAREVREQVLVERFAPGAEHRLLVVGGKVVSAVRREPAFVVGDGRSTIRQLVELENRQYRGDNPLATLFPLPWDEESILLLAEQGFSPACTPAAGRQVHLRRKYRAMAGGKNVDVTDELHPVVAQTIVDAVALVGLEIAGVDLVARDLRRPLEEQQGVIVEINAGPALFEHLPPYAAHRREVPEAIVELLFPANEQGRVPLAAIAGQDAASTGCAVAERWQASGRCTALATADKWQVGLHCQRTEDGRRSTRVQALLTHVRTAAAVVEISPTRVLEEGFGFDRCSQAIFLRPDVSGDPAERERQERVTLRLAELVLPDGVALIAADHPMAAALQAACPGRTIFVAASGSSTILKRWRRKGASVAFVWEGHAVLAERGAETNLCPADTLAELLAALAAALLPNRQAGPTLQSPTRDRTPLRLTAS